MLRVEDPDYLGTLAKDVYSVYQSKKNGTLHTGDVKDTDSGSYDHRLQELNRVMERVGANGQDVKQWLKNVDVSPEVREQQKTRPVAAAAGPRRVLRVEIDFEDPDYLGELAKDAKAIYNNKKKWQF